MVFQAKFSQFFALVAIVVITFVTIPKAEAMGGKSIFNGEPTEEQCRKCHGDNNNLPHPLLQKINPDRHHALIDKPIQGLYRGYHDSVAPGDTSSGVYKCFTCHGVYGSEWFKTSDCLFCHSAESVTGKPMRGSNVHHATDAFNNRNCNACHRFLSDGGGRGGMGGRR